MFEELVEEVDSFYYSYNLDFRSRVYPMATDAHPMGNKLSKALVEFKEKKKFNLKQFKCYCAKLHSPEITSNTNLIYYFDNYLGEKMENFLEKENLESFFQCEELFIFLRCCFEYREFLNFEKKKLNENDCFFSGLPIYLDATASGPQLITLFFALKNFATYLNLVGPHNDDTKLGDFYVSGVIKPFLTENIFFKNQKHCPTFLTKFNKSETSEQEKIFLFFRKMLKKPIMAQSYGITKYRVYKTICDFLRNEKNAKTMKSLGFNLEDTNNFAKEFVNEFQGFVDKLGLFQLKIMLNELINILGQKLPLEVAIFDKSVVSLQYTKKKRIKTDLRSKKNFFQLRTQVTSFVNDKNKTTYTQKQKSAAMANLIHAFDALVMFNVLNFLKKKI